MHRFRALMSFLGIASLAGAVLFGISQYELPQPARPNVDLSNRARVGDRYVVRRPFYAAVDQRGLSLVVAEGSVGPTYFDDLTATGDLRHVKAGEEVEILQVYAENVVPHVRIASPSGEAFAYTLHFGPGDGTDARLVTPSR